jgi:hypothetical protein
VPLQEGAAQERAGGRTLHLQGCSPGSCHGCMLYCVYRPCTPVTHFSSAALNVFSRVGTPSTQTASLDRRRCREVRVCVLVVRAHGVHGFRSFETGQRGEGGDRPPVAVFAILVAAANRRTNGSTVNTLHRRTGVSKSQRCGGGCGKLSRASTGRPRSERHPLVDRLVPILLEYSQYAGKQGRTASEAPTHRGGE